MEYVRFIAALVVTSSLNSACAVEVIEGRPDVVAKPTSSFGVQNSAPAAVPVSADMLLKVQQLEAEVRELRGLLEQQSYLIEQLTQRRLADYVELDKRILKLQNSSSVKAAGRSSTKTPVVARKTATPPKKVTPKAPAIKKAPRVDEAKSAYQAAYDLVKTRKFDQAKPALTRFVSSYPNSYYIPNALYWLGELHYLAGDLGKARDSFYTLVTEHSNFRKVPDAKFKLGKIYHQLGDADRAIVMLRSVLSDHSSSKAAAPARDYLSERLQ